MPQPGSKTLLNRRSHALPQLRIATDRGRSSQDPPNPRTPRLPSSPLVSAVWSADDDTDNFKDNAFGVSRLLDSPLPPSLSQLKVYAHGGASDLQSSIPGNSGVLASPQSNIFSDGASFLLRVDSSRERVDLGVAEDSYVSIAGGKIGVSVSGVEATSVGPQARAISVIPARGVAAMAFMRGGEARVNLARARPASPPPSSPVVSDTDDDVDEDIDDDLDDCNQTMDVPGGKRKREAFKAALPSSPEQPKRPRRVYTSATRLARESLLVPARPTLSTAPRRSSRATLSAHVTSAQSVTAPARDADASPAPRRASAAKAPSRRPAAPVYRPAPLSGLTFARKTDVIAAGVSKTTLQGTALAEIAATIMLHSKQLGKEFVQLLGHMITIDKNVAKSSYLQRLLVGRPVQVRFFAKNYCLLNPAVFAQFDGTYAIRFWSWWNVLVGDMCYPAPGALRQPGRLLANADLTPLLRGGQNGFGTVVVSLVLWIFGFMSTTAPTSATTSASAASSASHLIFTGKPEVTQVAAWSAAVAHVNYIAAAMVDSLVV
jgi:hypothetical protein